MVSRSFNPPLFQSKRPRKGPALVVSGRPVLRVGFASAVLFALAALFALGLAPSAINAARPPDTIRAGIATQGKFTDGAAADREQPRLSLGSRPNAGIALDGRPSAVTTTHWTNLFPPLYAVSAVSSAEAWAGGDYGHLIHYTGGSWVTVDPPELAGQTVNDIQMLSSTDGWLAAGDKAFRYNGTTWIDQSAGLSPILYLNAIAPLSDTDVWGIGPHYTTTGAEMVFLHWDGALWTIQGAPTTYASYLGDIDMVSATEGWATTGSTSLLHFDGSTWTAIQAPSEIERLSSVSGLPGEVWAAAGLADAPYYAVSRYTNGIWTTFALANNAPATAIWMLNPTSGWAATGQSTLAHWDGSTWTDEYTPGHMDSISGVAGRVWAVGGGSSVFGSTGTGMWAKEFGGPTTASINRVAAVSPDEAWAGATAVTGTTGVLLHYTGGTWQQYPTGLNTTAIYDVEMLSPVDGYAVGAGMIAHWDGASWTPMATPTAAFYGVDMLSDSEGWAVGSQGRIYHYSGGTWSQQLSPTNRNLRAVAMDSATHGWAVGGAFGTSMLLEYSDGEWIDQTSTLPVTGLYLRGILIVPGGGGEAWVTGYSISSNTPTLLHWAGGVWTAQNTPISYGGYTSLVPEALGEVWAVGCNAGHLVGGSWQSVSLPTQWCQQGASFVPGRGGWSVGPEGTILQYNPLVEGQVFYDVPPDNPFAAYINYLSSHNIISGYGDNTFRPYNTTTRGQLSKIIVLARAWPIVTPTGTPTFRDVPSTNAFYGYIETAYSQGIISGYSCGAGCLEFRWGNNVTRGQLTKIVVLAMDWPVTSPGTPTFVDVPLTDPFFGYIETAYAHGIISGYSCGTGCLEFRPFNNATRGQISKIVYNAITNP